MDLGGPDAQYGVSAPVVSGDTIVVVAPDQVLGVDATTGTQTWAVDRDLGPPVPAAIATVDGREVVVYTEGFGDGPPDPTLAVPVVGVLVPCLGLAVTIGSVDDGDEPTASGTFDSHLAAFDLRTQEQLFKPVPLDEVSRTGVMVEGSTAFVGANGGRSTRSISPTGP